MVEGLHERGVVELILEAMVELLTTELNTEIGTGDPAYVEVIKAGPRQAAPEAITVTIHENDPDVPKDWPHVPGPSSSELIGGGKEYLRSFTIMVEVFGRYMTNVDADREAVRRIASVVEGRVISVLHAAGPNIGTGRAVQGDFNETVIYGPVLGDSWADAEESESLIVRKFIRIRYKTFVNWSTNAW